jgi:hypothetical protein
MRSFFIALAGLVFFAGHPAQASVAISIDKNAQTMTVAVDGVERYHWPVSTGIPSYETPNGSFRTFRMEADHFSKEFDDAPMPHSIFFTKIGHAIHGTVYESRLGTPASHGCVRLSRAHAATLYALVQEQGVLNTTVTLTGSSRIALARNPRNVARYDEQGQSDGQSYGQSQGQSYDQTYASTGDPVQLTPQPQFFPGRRYVPQPRPDDGYIYPADGSSTQQIYPAPRTSRRYNDAQSYPQPQYQYYGNQGYNQGYAQQPQGNYYQQQPYQPRASYYQN